MKCVSCTRTVWLIDTENIPKKWVKTVYFKTKNGVENDTKDYKMRSEEHTSELQSR